jgi:hypothetical protein
MSTQTPVRVKLLLTRIYTVEQLGVLLAVGAPPQRAWTVEDLAGATRLPPNDVQNALHQLAKMPLMARSAEGLWGLLPDPETREVVANLVEVYQDNPVPVLRALSDNALERIRLAASRLLALRYGRGEPGSGSDLRSSGGSDPITGDVMTGDSLVPSIVLEHTAVGSRNGPRRD